MHVSGKLRNILMFGLPCVLGCTLLCGWMLLGWRNFDSDQAFGALSSKHVLGGEFRLYPWGQKYFGGVLFYPIAFFLWLCGTDSILGYQLLFILLFACWMTAAILLAYRWWGNNTALYTTWIALLPGQYLLRFIVGHSATFYGILSIACLLLSIPSSWRHPSFAAMRFLILGVLMGLGYWHSPSFVITIIAAVAVLMLTSSEWQSMWEAVRQSLGTRAVFFSLITVVLAGVAAASLVLFPGGESHVAFVGKTLLSLFVVTTAALLILFSQRRKKLLILSLLLGCGFILGNAPQWIDWLHTGIPPDMRLYFGLPMQSNVGAIVGILFPSFIGVPPVDQWVGKGMSLAYACTLATGIYCFVAWLWMNRNTWLSVFNGRKLDAHQATVVVLILLFAIPWVFLLFLHPYDVGQVRYVLETWPFWACIIGSILGRMRRSFALLLLVLITVPPLLNTGRYYVTSLSLNDGAFKPQSLQQLENFFEEHDVHGGYANYWSAFSLDFLLNERLTFTPYYGADRYPFYGQQVDDMHRFAFIVTAKTVSPHPQVIETVHIPADHRTSSQLRDAISASQIVQPRYQHVIERIERSQVIARRRIGYWDIWLLEAP